ncbi:MAG: hypothetical protein FJ030_11020 [Chloroflexi bacterium]|nr:hypothetical protein [Chloroflexota bacterium]
MTQENPALSRLNEFRRWLYNWITKTLRPPQTPAEPPRVEGPYPDYVTCPRCGELEVEVWSHEKAGRCHRCGQTFEYPLPRPEQSKPTH